MCETCTAAQCGGGMSIDPALLSPVSALLGAVVGGGASLLGAVYTQRSRDRVQRVTSEIAKRETVYAEFVMSASNFLLNAYTHDEIALGGDEQRLVGLMNRMRLFAPPDVVGGAEMVLKTILEIRSETEYRAPATRKKSIIRKSRSRPASGIQLGLPDRLGQCAPNSRLGAQESLHAE